MKIQYGWDDQHRIRVIDDQGQAVVLSREDAAVADRPTDR